MINKSNIKTCLITGATGGVGQSIVELLRKKYSLIIVSKDLKKLKLLKNKLEDNTKKIECISCDFAKINEVYSLIKKIKKKKLTYL
jgi:short-subunit dehydrogenase